MNYLDLVAFCDFKAITIFPASILSVLADDEILVIKKKVHFYYSSMISFIDQRSFSFMAYHSSHLDQGMLDQEPSFHLDRELSDRYQELSDQESSFHLDRELSDRYQELTFLAAFQATLAVSLP
jgi:hypothetical protein